MPIANVRKSRVKGRYDEPVSWAQTTPESGGNPANDRSDINSVPMAPPSKSLASWALKQFTSGPKDLLTALTMGIAFTTVIIAITNVHEWDRSRQADLKAAVTAHQQALDEWSRWNIRSQSEIENDYRMKLNQCNSVCCKLNYEDWYQNEMDHHDTYQQLYEVLKHGASLETLFRSYPPAKSFSTRDVIQALYSQIQCQNQTRSKKLIL